MVEAITRASFQTISGREVEALGPLRLQRRNRLRRLHKFEFEVGRIKFQVSLIQAERGRRGRSWALLPIVLGLSSCWLDLSQKQNQDKHPADDANIIKTRFLHSCSAYRQ